MSLAILKDKKTIKQVNLTSTILSYSNLSKLGRGVIDLDLMFMLADREDLAEFIPPEIKTIIK